MAHEGKRHGFAASGNKSVAEILNANKNSVAELISQEQSKNLASTYSSGDPLLARQLEARTYGVNDDLSITPGTETKWIDEIGDVYGTSKGNVILDTEKANTNNFVDNNVEIDTSKAAATSQFMSNYNDNQLYEVSPGNNIKVVDLNQKFNDETLNITTKDLKKTVQDLGVGSGRGLVVEEAGERAAYITKEARLEEQRIANEQMLAEHYLKLGSGSYLTGDPGVQFPLHPELNGPESVSYAESIEDLKLFKDGGDVSYYYETVDESGNDISVLIENESEEKAWKVDEINLTLQNITDGLVDTEVNKVKGIGTSVVAMTEQGNAEAEALAIEERKGMSDEQIAAIQTRKEEALEIVANKQAEYEKSVGAGRGTVVEGAGEREAHLKEKEHARVKAMNDKRAEAKRIADAKQEAERLLEQSKTSGTIGKDADIRSRQPKGTIYPGDPDNKVKGSQLVRLERERKQRQLKEDEHNKTLGLRHIGVGKETPLQTHTRKEASLAEKLKGIGNMPMFMSDAEKQKMGDILGQKRAVEETSVGDKEGQDWYKNYKNRMAKDPFRFSTFAYPRDVTTNMENGHYILFYVNVQDKTKYSYDGVGYSGDIVRVGDMVMKEELRQEGIGQYKTVSVPGMNDYEQELTKEVVHQSWTKGASKEFNTNIDYQKRRVFAGMNGSVLRSNMSDLRKGRKSYQGLDSVHKTTTRITDSVALYLPPGVSDNTSVVYSNAELGMAGFLAFSFGEVVNKWKAMDFEGVADTILDVGGTAFTETIKSLSLGAFGLLTGGEDVGSTFDKAFGQTLNPYIEVNFNSMGMRDFSYTFHFSPKSKQETQDVQDIITLFRFHMAPELKGTNHRYLTLPSTFDIHYMYQSSPETAHENTFYNKIATCVLTGCNVDYTPNGVRSFEDGAPTQINMTLNFSETKMLTKQRINDGF